MRRINSRLIATKKLSISVSRKIFLVIIAIISLKTNSNAQANFSAAGTYTQNFGTTALASWTDNSSFTGWYYGRPANFIGTYTATTGVPFNSGGNYMYACSVTPTDYKLGTRPSNASGGTGSACDATPFACGDGLGLRLVNNKSVPIQSIRVQYTAYQMSTSQSGTVAQGYKFIYTTGAAGTQTSVLNTSTTGITVPALDWIAPVIGPNGTAQLAWSTCASSMVTTISACIIVTIPVGDEIMLVWWDTNNSQNDPHVAIDDIIITAYSDNVCVTVLPIELMSFDAKRVDNKIELNWITTSEKNNDYFTIERSDDAMNFEPIAIIKGAGNSNGLRSYKDYDLKPLDADVVYYRLKQTDFDDTYTYSKMVAVKKTNLNTNEFSILPNPSESGLFTISGKKDNADESSTVEILDYTGRVISESTLQTNSSTIDLSTYSRGLYIVRITSGDKVTNHKIIYN
jgi:hypothetical protein